MFSYKLNNFIRELLRKHENDVDNRHIMETHNSWTNFSSRKTNDVKYKNSSGRQMNCVHFFFLKKRKDIGNIIVSVFIPQDVLKIIIPIILEDCRPSLMKKETPDKM